MELAGPLGHSPCIPIGDKISHQNSRDIDINEGISVVDAIKSSLSVTTTGSNILNNSAGHALRPRIY